ncbi:MAG: hypothetical protein QUV02_10335 [Maricaulis sp.]|uniref:hypothetical protein n=1 Tax=Maricaulis sp. TaxID=1486257 RepID=UPI00262E35EA|nr:hypothetical protein [Maricaulis sp.]MDM7984838.1 hypothetical protein [Maricaulis sp.]
MKTWISRIALTVCAAAVTAGCAVFDDLDRDDLPTAGELGAGDCHPAGPHDATAPGEWICPEETGHDRVQPRHRIDD